MLYILTITLDNFDELLATINALNQLECNHEIVHIIKNGRVADRSSDFVRECSGNIQNRRIVLVEQPDRGIYHAMNQALDHVPEGEWFAFINSGDLLQGTLSINDGHTCFLVPAHRSIGHKPNHYLPIRVKSNYSSGMPFCHQSLFLKKTCTMQFSLKYSISADYLFVLRYVLPLYPHGPLSIPLLSRVHVFYDSNGISSTRRLTRDFQALLIVARMMPAWSLFHFLFSRLLALPQYLIALSNSLV